jgi:hypothetical protein
MPLTLQATPSSVRKPVQSLRDTRDLRGSRGLAGHAPAPVALSPEARAHSIQKSRFARLPHEPEDARLTGITRSLARRLTALNIEGSLRSSAIRQLAQTA